MCPPCPNSASGKCHNTSNIRVTLSVEPAGALLPSGEGMSQNLQEMADWNAAIMAPSPFLLESFRAVINSLWLCAECRIDQTAGATGNQLCVCVVSGAVWVCAAYTFTPFFQLPPASDATENWLYFFFYKTKRWSVALGDSGPSVLSGLSLEGWLFWITR